MPLTSKGNEIMENMKEQYGDKKGESVFYASKNAGTITGVDSFPEVTERMGEVGRINNLGESVLGELPRHSGE